jgi:hypothetical protein
VAPKSTTDKQVAIARVITPKRSLSESKLQMDLQWWIAETVEIEQRFGTVEDDLKMFGLESLAPEDAFSNIMLGRKYSDYEELLGHVQAIVADRTLIAVREAGGKTSHSTQKDDPMDIGAVVQQALMAVGIGKGGSKGGAKPEHNAGKGYQPYGKSYEQSQQSDRKGAKGKSKGADPKGKGKGKGSDKETQ